MAPLGKDTVASLGHKGTALNELHSYPYKKQQGHFFTNLKCIHDP